MEFRMEFRQCLACPTGKSVAPPLPLSTPSAKNISLTPSGKSSLEARAIPARSRGALRGRHETLGGMRWTRVDRHDERSARGRRKRVVLMPRRWSSSRPTMLTHRGGDGDNKARSPGRARHRPLKPFACGNAGSSGGLVVANSCAFYFLHTRLRMRWASGIPHALFGRKVLGQPGCACIAGRRGCALVTLSVMAGPVPAIHVFGTTTTRAGLAPLFRLQPFGGAAPERVAVFGTEKTEMADRGCVGVLRRDGDDVGCRGLEARSHQFDRRPRRPGIV